MYWTSLTACLFFNRLISFMSKLICTFRSCSVYKYVDIYSVLPYIIPITGTKCMKSEEKFKQDAASRILIRHFSQNETVPMNPTMVLASSSSLFKLFLQIVGIFAFMQL